MQTSSATPRKRFFAALFSDFRLGTLIAPTAIRVWYGLSFGLVTLGCAAWIIAAVDQGSSAAIAAAIFLLPILYLLDLIFLRVVAEFLIVVFQLAEDVRAMRLGPAWPGPGPAWPSPASVAAQPPAGGADWQAQGPSSAPHAGGQLSPDGRYRWDGQSWQPTGL